ncbi:MAG: NUDIX domain-containing protein [Gammaproteobacteria bacterium]|nr:MAG: NUDIX domain-containing protein [Gammaproteobacteria bacterium]
MKYSIIKQAPLYKGFFELSAYELRHDLFAGGECPVITRELLDRKDASGILPYDPERDEVVLIEQFRIGAMRNETGPWLIEVIAGYQEPDENPEQLVMREAIEEADCTVTDLVPMCHYHSSPGSSNEIIHLFLGRTCSEGLGGIHGLAHEGEDIRVHVVSSDTAFKWLDSGRIDSGMAIIALQWFRLNRDKIRHKWLPDGDKNPSTI